MPGGIDALRSPTLKHVREQWWDEEFTSFLRETLRPRPGNRILDVGCGAGTAEIKIGRQRLSQVRLFGVDLVVQNVVEARRETAGHNLRAGFAAADACHLPFRDASFDSTYCVAVLQHIRDVAPAVKEFARVTRPGGRVLAVEPDNGSRYWFSSTPAGLAVFHAASRFFAAAARALDGGGEQAVGPKIPTLFVEHGIAPESVRLFPVSQTIIGAPDPGVWKERREGIARAVERAPEAAQAAGREYLAVLETYEQEATRAGDGFVEIQTTILFATVGQRAE
jgi:SAM-dependent methyltransferase